MNFRSCRPVRYVHVAALALSLCLNAGTVSAQTERLDEPQVEVERDGEAVIVEANMVVPASVEQAWSVLTDYDNMARFFPNIESSRVVARSDRSLQVEQRGHIRFGPFTLPFESLREIELRPFKEIRSRSVGGSLKRSTAITRLTGEAQGVRIFYRSESVPAVWTPPGIGPKFVAKETRAQFENLRAEILRRKGG